jgi:16S rRNA (guanine1207-N2)-methyltransferase
VSEVTLAVAPDAADRLILDEAAGVLDAADVLVVGSLPLLDAARSAGAARVRGWFDSAFDAERCAALGFEVGGPNADIDVVLLRLPKSLRELEVIARTVAANAKPSVAVFAGGRLKYMTPRMNDVLSASFERIDVSLARQKSRVLTAHGPRAVTAPEPKLARVEELDLVVGSVGGVFSSDGLDLGTRAMLAEFDKLPDYERAIDLGSGTGILAALLKRRRPAASVIASDVSADAVASSRATMLANGLDVDVVQEAALASQPDASADLIVLNPPFHDGGPISTDLAAPLFAAAARVLKPGAQLWTVFNSSLGYRADLDRIIGHTRQVSRTAKFTVTASVRRT